MEIPSNDSGLLSHWELDEASGDLAADSSGSGNDGTIAARFLVLGLGFSAPKCLAKLRKFGKISL
jgi:hypothetical protein